MFGIEFFSHLANADIRNAIYPLIFPLKKRNASLWENMRTFGEILINPDFYKNDLNLK